MTAPASWRWPNYLTRVPPGIDLEAETRRTLREVTAEIGAEFPGMLLGSVAEYCVRNGPCPVVVVRTPAG
jgi:hypothetical protein